LPPPLKPLLNKWKPMPLWRMRKGECVMLRFKR
jgi:hypothetical protein